MPATVKAGEMSKRRGSSSPQSIYSVLNLNIKEISIKNMYILLSEATSLSINRRSTK